MTNKKTDEYKTQYKITSRLNKIVTTDDRKKCVLMLGKLLIVLVVIGATPALATPAPVRAAVVRSQGTYRYPRMWEELNNNWNEFGNVPVEVDYTTLAGNNLTLQQIEATNANVLILSVPSGTYTDAEIDAIIDYVEAGHGIIVTYVRFSENKERLAQLVGLSESTSLGTNTFTFGIEFDLFVADHPVFNGVSQPYHSGVRFMAWPKTAGAIWPITTGQAIAESWSLTDSVVRHGIIIANQVDTYRGLYFSHYIESDHYLGRHNQQDTQVFYNGVLWTAGVSEPGIGIVDVDIKPQSCPNPLNVKSKGMLPVAILGTDDLDVTTIDPTSIRLTGVEPIRSGYEDVATPVSDSNDCNCTTDGPDGFLDLTLKFKTQKIVEAIDDVNDGDVLELQLDGVLYDQTLIEGADCILIRGKHKPINIADINKDGVVNAADFAIFAQNWLQSSIVDE